MVDEIIKWQRSPKSWYKYKSLCNRRHEITEVIQSYSILNLFVVSMWYLLRWISCKTKLLDLLEYYTLLLWNYVPSDNMMLALPEPSIKFVVSDIVLTLASSEIWIVIFTIKINEIHFYIRSLLLQLLIKFTKYFRVRHVQDQCPFITHL